MQCKICRTKIDDEKIKVKNGYICRNCYEAMPEGVKKNIKNFSIRQIFRLKKIVYDKQSKNWIESGNFGVGQSTISVNQKEYRIKDLKSIKLNFHPTGEGRHPKTAVGIATVIIETKSPHVLIEEPFYPSDVTVGYGISGKKINYFFSYAIEALIKLVQKCIDEKEYDTIPFIEEYKSSVQKETGYTKKKKEEAKRKAEEKKKEEEKRKKAEKEERARKKAEEKRESYKGKVLSPFDEAKVLFEVEMPYTKDQIKKMRNQLIKKHHPDLGGTEEMCKKINEAYALLMKFASS